MGIIHVAIWRSWAIFARLRQFGFIYESSGPFRAVGISRLHILISIIKLYILSLNTFSRRLMLSILSILGSPLSVISILRWLKTHILILILLRHAWLLSDIEILNLAFLMVLLPDPRSLPHHSHSNTFIWRILLDLRHCQLFDLRMLRFFSLLKLASWSLWLDLWRFLWKCDWLLIGFYSKYFLVVNLLILLLMLSLWLWLSLVCDVHRRKILLRSRLILIVLDYLGHLAFVHRVILRQLDSDVYLLVERFVYLVLLLLVRRSYLGCGCHVYLLLGLSRLRGLWFRFFNWWLLWFRNWGRRFSLSWSFLDDWGHFRFLLW